MEWKKSDISQSELEKQQQAYIKEALEMAKRSVALQFEKTSALEKAEAERIAAEKAEAERIAAEKAEAERIAAEKAEAERIAAEKAETERIAAEKAEAERIAAEKAEAERIAAEKVETERIAAEKAEAERIAAQKTEIESEKNAKEENNTFTATDDETSFISCSDELSNQPDKDCVIDVEEVKKSMVIPEKYNNDQMQKNTQSDLMNRKQGNPPNFNRYINDHNRNQCNCPNCQRRRLEQH